MENKKIIEMIDENRIEELREMIIQEICVKESKNSNTQKGLLALSKTTKKEMEKERPALAGAYFNNGNTYISNGFYLIKIFEERQGLEMVKRKADTLPNFDQILGDINFDNKIEVDKSKITIAKTNKEHDIRIGNHLYQTKYADLMLKCFDDTAKFYEEKNFLVIRDMEKIGILLKLREV